MKSFTLIIFCFLLLHCYAKEYRSENEVTNHMLKYVLKAQKNEDVDEFKKIIKVLGFPTYVLRTSFSSYTKGRAALSCFACRSAVTTIKTLYDQGVSEEELIEQATNLCILLKIQSPKVCKGVVRMNAPIFVYIFKNQPRFSARSFCGVVLQTPSKNSCPFKDERYEWTIDIPANNKFIRDISSDYSETFNVVHLTDSHYDPIYEPSGLAACDDPVCCRRQQTERESRQWTPEYEEDISDENVFIDDDGEITIDIDYVNNSGLKKSRAADTNKEADKAGYWGDYRNCDTPWWAYVDGITHIAENHKDAEFIYYTGDTVDHGVWETSKELITNSLNDTLNKFKDVFGNKPMYPGVGNHESQPVNQFAPPSVTDSNVSTTWLYDLLYKKWSFWLPKETKETILKGGYYTVLVKPGLRVVVLNSNLCYIYNWWVHLDPHDPSDQLKWLVDVLYQAENAGEKVHLLTHIPAGKYDVFHTCSREYARIIRRFAKTVVAEFSGHTHNDEFKVFYDESGSEPLLMGWNGGSLTAFSFVNPNYRIFKVDKETYNIVDFDTWIYNLTEANLTPEKRPRWFKEYSFKDYFKVKSLQAKDVDKLVQRMVSTDKNLLRVDYQVLRGKSSDPYINDKCDNDCVKSNLCYMVTSELYDNTKCEALWQEHNKPE